MYNRMVGDRWFNAGNDILTRIHESWISRLRGMLSRRLQNLLGHELSFADGGKIRRVYEVRGREM